MMMTPKFVSTLMQIGTEMLDPVEASKVQITNIVALITCVVSLINALNFHFALDQGYIALANLGFVLCYFLPVLINYKYFYRLAKSWFFMVLIAHVCLFGFYVFSQAAGFHFYYLIIIPGVFLLFNQQDKIEKFAFCLLAILLFFVSELSVHSAPMIVLAPAAENTLFLSVIFVIMTETYFIMSVLSRNIGLYENELKLMASTDILTGINNRRIFMLLGKELFEHARRYNNPLSLMMLDIDYFKKINDQYGHLVGDKALQQVALTLQANLRASDVLARYGGEEFVILLPQTDSTNALELAQKLREEVSLIRLEIKGFEPISFTTSIGLAQYHDQLKSVTQLLNNADKALYQAKKAGRNKVLAYQV